MKTKMAGETESAQGCRGLRVEAVEEEARVLGSCVDLGEGPIVRGFRDLGNCSVSVYWNLGADSLNCIRLGIQMWGLGPRSQS